MGKISFQDGIQVPTKYGGTHGHGITACDKDVGNLGILLQVFDKQFGLFHTELHIVHSGELGPPEAEGAVGMTGLSLGEEEEHRLPVFVLNTQ